MNTTSLDEYITSRNLDREKLERGADSLQQAVRAARLRDVRAAANTTQEQLAEQMHVSQKRISQIELGQIGATKFDTLRRYVEALGGTLNVEAQFGDTAYKIG